MKNLQRKPVTRRMVSLTAKEGWQFVIADGAELSYPGAQALQWELLEQCEQNTLNLTITYPATAKKETESEKQTESETTGEENKPQTSETQGGQNGGQPGSTSGSGEQNSADGQNGNSSGQSGSTGQQGASQGSNGGQTGTAQGNNGGQSDTPQGSNGGTGRYVSGEQYRTDRHIRGDGTVRHGSRRRIGPKPDRYIQPVCFVGIIWHRFRGNSRYGNGDGIYDFWK